MIKKLKSLFIVEDESSKETAKQTQDNPNTKKEPSIKIDTSVPEKGTGKPDEKFVTRLLQAIEDNNIDGFDYLEYKQSIASLDSMNMDEGTRYKSSMAMAKTMGATKDSLISSAQHYLKVLKTEETKFQDALRNQHDKVVTGTEQELKSMQTSIDTKQKQIEQLRVEIEQTKLELEKKKSSVDSNLAKINSTKEGFYAAYHIVVDQIEDDVSKMNQYLS